VIHHSIRKNQHGEPVLTIRITGGNEIFRFAFHLAHGQVEFLAIGSHAFRYLRKRWGSANFREHDRRMTSGKVVQYGYQVDRGRDE
jgi:hypothetical protein